MKTLNVLVPALLITCFAGWATPAVAETRSLVAVGSAQAGPRDEIVVQTAGGGFATAFTGTVLYATIDDPGGHRITVESSGASIDLDLMAGAHTYLLFQGEPGTHKVRVTRHGQGAAGRTVFAQIRADGELRSPELTAPPVFVRVAQAAKSKN